MLLNVFKGLQSLQAGCIEMLLSACWEADADLVIPAPGRVPIIGMPFSIGCLRLGCLYYSGACWRGGLIRYQACGSLGALHSSRVEGPASGACKPS